MDDSNASYGFNDMFFEYPPASDDPPEDIFEDQNLNNSLQPASEDPPKDILEDQNFNNSLQPASEDPPEDIFEDQNFNNSLQPASEDPPEVIFEDQNLNNSLQAASTSQGSIDPNDSAVSGNESVESNQDRSFGLPGLFQQVQLPDDLFKVGSPSTSENPLSICSPHSSLSELLTPGSPGTIHEIFGSAVDPVEELPNEQVSTNTDSSDSSGTMTCPGLSPTFLSESESDPMHRAGASSLSDTHSFGTNTLASFQSTGPTPGNPESSAVLDAEAAFINYELSLNLDTSTKLSSPHGAQRIETDAGPSTASHAVPQPGSPYLHDHRSHNVLTDFIPPTVLLAVPQPGSPYFHDNLSHNVSTYFITPTVLQAVPQPGSLYFHDHPSYNVSTDFIPPTVLQAVPQPGSLYFYDHPIHNVSTDFIPPTVLQAVPQPGSPNVHGHPRHNYSTDSEPSTSTNAVRPKVFPYSSCNPMRNPATESVPSSPSLAPHQEELPYSFRHPRRNSATESIPSTLSQAGRQEVSPYSRRHPRRRTKADSEPSTLSQAVRQEGSSDSRRNSKTCSIRAAPFLSPSAAFVAPLRLQNVGSPPNSMGSDELSYNAMEVSRPVFHGGQQGSLAESQASVIPLRPSSLDVLSGSIISSRKVTRCPRCPALRFHPLSPTVTELERCMLCGARSTRE